MRKYETWILALCGKITFVVAADVLGLTEHSMLKALRRHKIRGFNEFHDSLGRDGLPIGTVEFDEARRVARLYRDEYYNDRVDGDEFYDQIDTVLTREYVYHLATLITKTLNKWGN